ncbi:YuzF family protein [Alkalicoccobacillus porphyridii]|uniref:YuzF family protein n=1 Tax=Alkalicoccobacillus porphyridii TaxID=2597270 RepID=UPI0021B09EA9|nr:YuzF family protein [Alkalicoccobacillus porphyridii]
MDEQLEWTLTDPYLYSAVSEYLNKLVEVQTTRGGVRGTLLDVQPDHLVIEMGGTPFFVRTQQIIWFFPAK